MVQSDSRLKVVEIRNVSYPVIVNDFVSATMTPVYQIAVTADTIIYPTNEILNLFKGATYYFSELSSQTNVQGQKIFISQFFAVNPKTLDKTQQKVQLLKLDTDEPWPFWMTMNFDTNYLTITPPAMESLTVMRKVKMISGTQILKSELAALWPEGDGQPLQSELMFQNYIDSLNIPTNNFNPNIPVVFNNASFNGIVSQVTVLLNSHLETHYVTFVLKDFIDLDTPPKSSVSLQKQWSTYVTPVIDRKIDFQFGQESFIDPDGDRLTYSVSGLPSFLQFYSSSIKLYGTPTKYDLGVYNVTMTATDGYKNTSQKFVITVKNEPPVYIFPGNYEFVLGERMDWQLPPSTFSDPDGDSLTYSIKMLNGLMQEVYAPSWINLDTTRLRIYGKPGASNIAVDLANKRYYQVFPLRMTAKDIADKTCSFDFNLTVTNYFPVYNTNLTLQSQFDRKYGGYVKLEQLIDFEFSTSTFSDRDSASLVYKISGCRIG